MYGLIRVNVLSGGSVVYVSGIPLTPCTVLWEEKGLFCIVKTIYFVSLGVVVAVCLNAVVGGLCVCKVSH